MKYTLDKSETKQFFGVTLRRVVYADGARGGWIESEANLSQSCTARVSGEAYVSGNACVSGSVQVSGNAYVSGVVRVESDRHLCCVTVLRFTATFLPDGYDAVYVPQVGYTTGDIDLHDIAVDADGRVVFINTLFGCLATLSDRNSFEPIWKPPFLSKLAPEDRCHLNGLALRDGRPRYVTAHATTDATDSWRDRRVGGGVVVDVETNEIICDGLSMPHSPRWHNDTLYVLNSGTGFFGKVDLATGQFEPITFCPGYLRGLTFVDQYAIVGLSNCRENRTFADLPLDDELARRNSDPRCALNVIDLHTGDIVHHVRLEGVVRELYDVVALPTVRRPMSLGFKSNEIERTYVLPPGTPSEHA